MQNKALPDEINIVLTGGSSELKRTFVGVLGTAFDGSSSVCNGVTVWDWHYYVNSRSINCHVWIDDSNRVGMFARANIVLALIDLGVNGGIDDIIHTSKVASASEGICAQFAMIGLRDQITTYFRYVCKGQQHSDVSVKYSAITKEIDTIQQMHAPVFTGIAVDEADSPRRRWICCITEYEKWLNDGYRSANQYHLRHAGMIRGDVIQLVQDGTVVSPQQSQTQLSLVVDGREFSIPAGARVVRMTGWRLVCIEF